jgi:hypothetical protein
VSKIDNLPSLPHSAVQMAIPSAGIELGFLYTAAQMREYALAARRHSGGKLSDAAATTNPPPAEVRGMAAARRKDSRRGGWRRTIWHGADAIAAIFRGAVLLQGAILIAVMLLNGEVASWRTFGVTALIVAVYFFAIVVNWAADAVLNGSKTNKVQGDPSNV